MAVAKNQHSRKKPAANKTNPDASLRKHLVELLNAGNAHVTMADAFADFSAEKRGAYANGLEHTAWHLLEHLRIAQGDILEFSHKKIDFQSLLRRQIRRILQKSRVPMGDGQTVLREALVLADHNAYHVGQMVDLRRALGIWKKS